ncbi:MAG: SDR family NAD(P)-dependent oxidoreductase [Candidatus Omnitrophica bacterium]|nr:SDR family NAD(P)-dependent oxidoreductase [Candidatus Omnitrophota bacterium]
MMYQLDPAWFRSKTAVVTGASSGIGLEMAKLLVSAHSRVIVCARDKGRLDAGVAVLKALNAGEVIGITADLAVPSERQDMIRRIQALGPVDILINNAGFGYMGDFISMPKVRMVEMQAVNMMALSELAQAFMAPMKERRSGGILNVGSVASFFPTPGSSFYAASKYFVRGLTEGLHAELSSYGIHVTGLYPGVTMTGFLRRATDGRKDQWPKAMTPALVAYSGLEGLRQNKVRVIPGLVNQAMVLVANLMPAAWFLSITGKRKTTEVR